MKLSKKTLENIRPAAGLTVPGMRIFNHPEKVLQFGTGVLLRGLPDYFVDKANRAGEFNGRIVVVKSTSNGSADAFEEQDGLYTVCVRGIENGREKDEKIIQSCISRVLSADESWAEVLECASNPEMKVIISNTTEVGIQLVEDDIRLSPPRSFPGKLLAFLHARFNAFRGTKESGMVIIPTELITENGKKLREIVLQLAERNKLQKDCIEWIATANHFCDSLVDRIVPGKLPPAERAEVEKELGYEDDLMIMAEPFRLWAIESSDPVVRETLSFAKTDRAVVIAPDIEKFRELKLRLLNGTHSLACGLANLHGFKTVKEAMAYPAFASFVRQLAFEEIAQAIESDEISLYEAQEFAQGVIERFANPFLDHQWSSIASQYGSKMRLRVIPILQKHYARTGRVPAAMALGFAAYIVFARSMETFRDDQASHLQQLLKKTRPPEWAGAIMTDVQLWGEGAGDWPGFVLAVQEQVDHLQQWGARVVLKEFAEKTNVFQHR